jgi:DNA invertase Pin-like site-specific DNA recombinase
VVQIMTSKGKRGIITEKAAIGYVRVSTDDQTLSVEAQRDRLAAWCRERGRALKAVYEDIGVSGGAPLDKRPGLMAALDSLHSGVVLVAIKRDRLARDTMTAAMIERLAERAGARVATCDGTGEGDTPEAVLLRTMIDAFAQYELALIPGRTKLGLARKRAKGEKTGGYRPYGFQVATDGATLLAGEPEQAMLHTIYTWADQGLSQLAILRNLAAAGYRIRAGTPMTRMQLYRLLKRRVSDATSGMEERAR